MNIYKLKEELIEYVKSIGVDKIGFMMVDIFDSLRDWLIFQELFGYLFGFEELDIEKWVILFLFLLKVKLIVVIVFVYFFKMKDVLRSMRDGWCGIFCRVFWGKDYYDVLWEKFDLLENFF